jgi:uncharacterized membrane protein
MERSMNARIAGVLALVAAGLLAGALFFGRANVLPAFAEVPLEVHLTFRVALFAHNGVVMPILMGVAFAGEVWLVLAARGRVRTLAVAAAGLTAVTFAVTRFANVPMNDEMRGWLADGPAADHAERLQLWGVYNDIRLVTALAAFGLLAAAVAAVRVPAEVGAGR